MNARVTFRHETLHQTGTVGKVLMWLQEEPKRGRNTNITKMAQAYGLSHGGKTLTNKSVIQKMVTTQMLSRFGNKRRSNFYINYLHKDIPGYILDKAPAEERRRVEELKAGLKENQYIDESGCIVTEGPKEKEKETTITENETNEESNLQNEVVESSSDASEENTTSVPIKVEDTERGLSISITLNLNINK